MRILITGGTGMVGSAFANVETKHKLIRYGSQTYNLLREQDVCDMLYRSHADAIIHLAAKVGGVKGNSDYMADFFYENSMINLNLLNGAKDYKIKKVVSLLSTCVYPNDTVYPLKPCNIHYGEPHPSNFGYAYAKRMLDVHSRAITKQFGYKYITAIPNNLYGINDNFDLENSHVIPAIIRKIYEGKSKGKKVILWGSGISLREFTYSKDIAKILLKLIEDCDNIVAPINIGKTGEYTIKKVAQMICDIFEYDFNKIEWDLSKPEGQHRKPSSNNLFRRLYPGFEYTELKEGLEETCSWFKKEYPNVRL
jgi:GDP-L-fucose synthase